MVKRFLAALVFSVACISGSFGRSLSFQVVQHNDSLNEVCSSALVIEDEILNFFYDAGYIVTNVPAAVSKSEEQDVSFYQKGFNDASDGSFDDFVLIKLYFTGSEDENKKVSLGNMQKLSWKVVSTKNGTVLEEGCTGVEKEVLADNEKNVREFASEFAVHLNNVLRKRS
ncbi:MAG: hypothetical protein UHO11_12410 [Treponema sp.]|nr:hypothetical protein [Treponema sp.]